MKYFKPLNYIRYFQRLLVGPLKKRKNRKIYSESFINKSLKKISTLEELIDFHFRTYSEINHINKEMFTKLLNNFDRTKLNILETGSSAHGTNSSMLFINYVKKFGGSFKTVDINSDIKSKFNHLIIDNIEFYKNYPIQFLKNLTPANKKKTILIYFLYFKL